MNYYPINVITSFNKIAGFGVFDPKDREIGARYCVRCIDVEQAGEWRPGALDDRFAHFAGKRVFSLSVHATRGGEDFGPCQRTRYFATEAERNDALEAYLSAAVRRAHRKADVEIRVA